MSERGEGTVLSDEDVGEIVDFVANSRGAIVRLLRELAEVESPSLVPESQKGVQALITAAFESLGFESHLLEGETTGGHLYFNPRGHTDDEAVQLLLGHTDTVWSIGTLEDMPVELDEEKGILRGPGVFDMKGGIVQMVFALRALAELGHAPVLAPVVFLNSDEEIGSPESRPHVERLARRADRVLVLEPALGPEGMIKTTRRGVGQFDIRVVGRASHAGLALEQGASAIQELSHVIQSLHGLTDPERGVGVNVGEVCGGTRVNVVAAEARAVVDVRVSTQEGTRWVEKAIRGLEAKTPGTRLEISGGVDRAPMEATPANQLLWEAVRECGRRLGVELVGAESGGASDGNITSLYAATADGLGAVGDGAHARHEYVNIDKLLERTTLLALILMLPPLEG